MSVLAIVEGEQHVYADELLHRKIERNIDAGCGTKTAIIYNDPLYGEKRVSYDDMNKTANRIARYLLEQARDAGSKPNSDNDWIIGICMKQTDEALIAVLAIMKTGAAYMPVDAQYPAQRVEHMLCETKPVALIYERKSPNWTEEILSGTKAAISWKECLNASMSFSSENLKVEEMFGVENNRNVVLIEYTSGSTGLAKGVRIHHAMIMNRLNWQFDALPFTPDETTGVFKTVISFVDSVTEIFGPLLTGRTLLVVPREDTKDPSKFVDLLDEYKVRRLVVVPIFLKTILTYLKLQKETKHLQHLTLLIASGEILPQKLAIEFFEYFDEKKHVLLNLFGSTEISGDVLYYIVEGKAHARRLEKVPIGYPIFNTAIYALDDELRPVRRGMQGELHVSGLNLALGYTCGREDERFCPNPLSNNPNYDRLYRTGDIIRIDKDDLVHYEGRTDTQVKVRGHRVNLREIEMQLMTITSVQQSITLAYRDGKEDQALLSFIVVDENQREELSERVVKDLLRTKLTDYMIPDQIIQLNSLPLTTSGKADRQSLLALFESEKMLNIPHYYNYAGVSSSELLKTKALFETIADVTQFAGKGISIHSNFYEIGGNSLNSILTVAQLRYVGYNIRIGDFIAAKSLEEIISKMNDDDENDEQIQSIAEQMHMETAMLTAADKTDTIELISRSFYDKSELDAFLVNIDISLNDYIETLDAIWDEFLANGLCFCVKDNTGRVIGVCLNYDLRNEPNIPFVGGCAYAAKLIHEIENPVKHAFPEEKKILFAFMSAPHYDLTPSENVAVMAYFEEEVLRMANENGFDGILTVNTSSLTQQLAEYNEYKTLNQIQANQFVVDGIKPYAAAPDSYHVAVQYKELDKQCPHNSVQFNENVYAFGS